ncbi:hypothetical protein [Cryptosporangium sp. NPDC051539]|uniref:hypothetical protein n=1 Tax=Cryptosporangium sp. NPDC051539 TaxID=3363962 RepID=UPI0037A8F2C3
MKLISATVKLGAAGLLLVGAAACSSGNSTGPAKASEPTASRPAASQSAGSQSAGSQSGGAGPDASQTPEPAGNGCPSNNAKVPSGAHTAATADLDLDGDADTLWIADVDNTRYLGVRTATGATFSTTFNSAAPQAAAAVGQKLDPAGPSIVLLNLGRSVQLYDVIDCGLVPVKNAQGAQYTFDLGFTGYGTGVQCVPQGSRYALAGLLAAPEKSGGGFRVTRTTITLSDYGRRARNGTSTVLARHAAVDSAVVKQAHAVTCGPAAPVTEPQTS